MKKISIILGLLLLSLSNFAQERKHQEADRFEKLKTELNLSPEQAEQLQALLKERKAEMHEKRKERVESTEEMKMERKEMHQAFREKISTILSDEQLKKFDELNAKKRERIKHHRQEHKPRPEQKMEKQEG